METVIGNKSDKKKFSLWLMLYLVIMTTKQSLAVTTTENPVTVTEHPCVNYGCSNGAEYYLDQNQCYCNCTLGFAGTYCTLSAVVGLANTISADLNVDIQEAEQYATDASAIIYDQVDQSYNNLDQSAQASLSVGSDIVYKVGLGATPGDNFTTLTTQITVMTASVFTATSTCANAQIAGCSLTTDQTKAIIDKTEENLGNMIHLMLSTNRVSDTPSATAINRDNISITVLNAKGRDLPTDYTTSYGSLSLPYYETFQDQNNGREVLLSLISYEKSPYIYSSNKDEITTSVVKVNATKKNGKELSLSDPDDPISLGIDTTSVFADETTWKEMEEFVSVEGTFMLVAFFNYSVNAIIIEMRIKTLKECDIYGKNGHTEPSETDFDIYIQTKGKSKIKEFKPDNLNLGFQNQELRLTLINENISEVMDPLVLTLLCEDYKLGSFGLPIHEYRIADVDLRYYNREAGTWNKSTELKLSAGAGKSVGFKSNFFGTFSANVLFIPPEPIDFVAIFLNFSERLLQTPHSLATSTGLLIIFVLIAIPLRRLDKKDSLLWKYLQLIDNKPETEATFSYEVVVVTGVRSSKRFSATPYFAVKGLGGETGIRILLDGIRENYTRGTSSHFIMRTPVHLGQLTELRVWHDSSGKTPAWLLSRIIVVDKHTDERYVFLCGQWLAADHEDGQTWRTLVPAVPEVLDGNIMFSELSKNHLFDDHLWLSVSMRPNFSRFTRVQRLWTIVSLLFLSMIASAMWYNTADPTGGSSVSIGPLKLNYKVVYVGFMSALIAALPSVVIMSIFKYRRIKGEGRSKNKVKDINDTKKLQDDKETGMTDSRNNLYDENPETIYDKHIPSTSTVKTYDEGFGSMLEISDEVDDAIEAAYSDIIQNTTADVSDAKDGVPSNRTDKGAKIISIESKRITEIYNARNRRCQELDRRHCDGSIEKFNIVDETRQKLYASDHKLIYLDLIHSTQANISCVRDGIMNYKLDVGTSKVGTTIREQSSTSFGIIESLKTSRQNTPDGCSVQNAGVLSSPQTAEDKNLQKGENKEKQGKQKVNKPRSPCLLPWWFIFVAYFLIISCIGASAYFTFMYTLQWGPEQTGEWMMAFFFGTIQSVLLIEPFKAIAVALIFVCFCKRTAVGKLSTVDNPSVLETRDNPPGLETTNKEKDTPKDETIDGVATDNDDAVEITEISLFEYPGGKEEDANVREYKRKAKLDRRLVDKFRLLIGQCIYITIIAIICSHNIITTSYYQNAEILGTLNMSYQPNSSDDIWNWLEGSFTNTTFPKWYYNDNVRSAYIQRFMDNTYNMRLGFARVRQVRVNGSCTVVEEMKNAVEICPNSYTAETEETRNFCIDWVPFNASCFDENEETELSFQYTYENVTKALPYTGTFGTYGGGGYLVDLGPKQSLVISYLQKLKSNTWIDDKTRAVFADAFTFNSNTRIFTHLRVVFEKPEIGGIFMKSDIWSANLYPYVTAWDYAVMGCQILFIIILFVRMILFLVSICRLRLKCCTSMAMWIRLLEIALAIGAIVCFIMRIDNTITAIETVFNNFGKFTSFELIHILDDIYKTLIASVMFIAILELLKPLTFNYHLYLVRTSIAISGSDLFGMFFMVFIPLFAFATLIYLLTGHLEKDFRDIPNSLLSLIILLIGMVNLQNKNQFDDVLVDFIYGTYTIVMTMILISVFISILSLAFNEVKSQELIQDEDTYDAELNEHLVNKITSVFANLKRRKAPPKSIEDEEDVDVVDMLMKKVIDVEQVMMSNNKEELRYHRKLAYGLFGMVPPNSKLACMITWQSKKTVLTYTNKQNLISLKLTIPDESWNGKINVSADIDSNKNKKLPFDVTAEKRGTLFYLDGNFDTSSQVIADVYDVKNFSSTNNQRSSVYASYDQCQTWEKCTTKIVYPSSTESQIKFRTVFEKCPTHLIVIAKSKFDTDDGDDESNSSPQISELFEIQPQGGVFISSVNEEVIITFEPETVSIPCSLLTLVKPFGMSPLLELKISEDIQNPLKIQLPCTSDLEQESSETIVLLRKGDDDWIKLNVVLDFEENMFNFPLPTSSLSKNIPSTIIVKESEIGWVVRSGVNKSEDLFDSSTIRTIAANIVCGHAKLAKYLNCEIKSDQNSSKSDMEKKQSILQKWSEDNISDNYTKMKMLEKILQNLCQPDLVNWLKQEEFNLRCSSINQQEGSQIVKAINVVSRFEIVARKWMDLAVTLAVDEKFVQNLYSDIPRCSEEKCSLVLFQWYKEDNTASVFRLSNIMQDMGFKQVAEGLNKIA